MVNQVGLLVVEVVVDLAVVQVLEVKVVVEMEENLVSLIQEMG
jgi:hypothetical protein